MSSGEESVSTAVSAKKSCSPSPVLPESPGSNSPTIGQILSQPRLSALAGRALDSSEWDEVISPAVSKLQMSSGEESDSTAVSCSAASPVLPESQGSNFLILIDMLSQSQLSAMADRTQHSTDQDKSSLQWDSVNSSSSHEDYNRGGLHSKAEIRSPSRILVQDGVIPSVVDRSPSGFLL